jgi:hypothetical protein
VRYLPADAALWAIHRDGPEWSVEAHLLDDLRMLWSGTKDKPAKPHPMRPKPVGPGNRPERQSKIRAARARMREQMRQRREMTEGG